MKISSKDETIKEIIEKVENNVRKKYILPLNFVEFSNYHKDLKVITN
jgi:hypothetical protein